MELMADRGKDRPAVTGGTRTAGSCAALKSAALRLGAWGSSELSRLSSSRRSWSQASGRERREAATLLGVPTPDGRGGRRCPLQLGFKFFYSLRWHSRREIKVSQRLPRTASEHPGPGPTRLLTSCPGDCDLH